MGKPEFVYVTYIATTPEKLWAALTDGAFTKSYWYDRRIESTWTVGAALRFYDGDSDVVTDSGTVLECDPPRRLVYSFRPEWSAEARAMPHSRVAFSLEPHEGMVKLTLLHDELESDELARQFREGWAPILSSLKTLLETGTPLPRMASLVAKGRPETR
jgi:uncharacterized protein YndB with AHSA1/START domain